MRLRIRFSCISGGRRGVPVERLMTEPLSNEAAFSTDVPLGRLNSWNKVTFQRNVCTIKKRHFRVVVAVFCYDYGDDAFYGIMAG